LNSMIPTVKGLRPSVILLSRILPGPRTGLAPCLAHACPVERARERERERGNRETQRERASARERDRHSARARAVYEAAFAACRIKLLHQDVSEGAGMRGGEGGREGEREREVY
jgi:hypothetical protein